MKKILLLIVFVLFFSLFISCNEKKQEKDFMSLINEESVYCASGIMESFYPNGRKQNDFKVYYKGKDLIKVELSQSEYENNETKEKQIIIKNKDGVFILVPSVNKNFKIQSDWPNNVSYPYLLTSLVKDINNDGNKVVSEDEESICYEVKTTLRKGKESLKEKIIVDKNTMLPEEVLVYDENDDLFIRVVYKDIKLNDNINDNEFIVDETMNTIKEELNEEELFTNRTISYPALLPEGMKLVKESTSASSDGKEVLTIMKYEGNELSFTLIEEYINAKDYTTFQQETGEVISILGNIAICKENSVITVINGIEYTIASQNLSINEMINVIKNFMYDEEK